MTMRKNPLLAIPEATFDENGAPIFRDLEADGGLWGTLTDPQADDCCAPLYHYLPAIGGHVLGYVRVVWRADRGSTSAWNGG